MNTHYYVEIDEQQYGPYELEQVKEFGLFTDTLVLKEGDEDWKHAAEYPELADWVVTSNTAVLQETVNNQSDIFNTNYYYRNGEQIYGPFSVYELGALDIESNTLLVP